MASISASPRWNQPSRILSVRSLAFKGVGGWIGTLLLAVCGQSCFGGLGAVKSIGTQLGIQASGLGAVIGWSAGATAVIALFVKATPGLRVSKEQEYEDMDQSKHGEKAYPNEP